MEVLSLATEQFRNLSDAEIAFGPRINVLFGDNAQGKTNLIEAIWLFSGAKSFRGSKDNEMIAFGAETTSLTLRFRDNQREQTAKIQFGGKDKKKVWLNKVPLESQRKLAGSFYAVVFAPAHLSIISEGPKNRRKFLDSAISQINPQYADYLNRYEKVLLQRNCLLKDCYKNPSLRDTIELWDSQLAKIGSILTIYRKDYVSKLNDAAEKIYQGLSQNKEKIAVSYSSTVFGEEEKINVYEDSVIEKYFQALSEHLEEDIRAGMTSVGVQRDEIEVMIDGYSAKTYGSQGQKRSCALTLKLAEASLLHSITGENPVILLDDVMSELDAHRQDYILNHVKNDQVFITCCDISNALRLKQGQVFHLENGIVSHQTQK